ncbi:MAG: type II toxin-antitoxin system VapB family antitoxin [Chloroflexi bacterium]|nr:type II toxin-antitoxin system VapB family antitoxin [Chloroflexota bacterium]
MSLNIKNEETCRLASELANLTGETMTGAITVALRERLEREKHQRSVEERLRRIRAIAERCAAELREAGPAIDHAELLYDEWGLPK